MSEPDYHLWWEQEVMRRVKVERILDHVLGENETDGAGAGLVADVALAVKKAWDQGFTSGISAPANRALGLGNPSNPYNEFEEN